MARIVIDGREFVGTNITVRNGTVTIDGKPQEGALSGIVELRVVEGVLGRLEADGSVTCGPVTGNVSAGGSVTAANIGGSVGAGGSIRCGDIGGNASAGGRFAMANRSPLVPADPLDIAGAAA